jgi:glycosyltransferase involved in cell wall biosynthesis
MEQPRVSVVIPTFNRRQPLQQAIDSVLRQTRPVDELVVVDDGSTDGTFEWLSESFAQIRSPRVVILQQKNAGPSAARNAGIERASGQLIAFLDDDDTWHPDKMQRQLAELSEHPDIYLLGCAADTLKLAGGARLIDIGEWHLLFRNWFLTPGVVVRRDALIECGGFPEDMRHCEDYALWLKIASRFKCAFLNKELVSCGHGKPSFGHSGLSADLRALHSGELNALARWRKSSNPGMAMVMLAAVLASARHLRRLIVTTWQKAI